MAKSDNGDLVYDLDSTRKIGFIPKLQPAWKGPYVISKVISPILFEVADKKKPLSYIMIG